jgi:hypothetical protein
MMRIRSAVAVAAVAALGATTLAVTALPGQAESSPTLTKLELESEFIWLDTSTNTVSSTRADSAQSIVTGCSQSSVLSPSDTLLTITAGASRDKLGYINNGIGVAGRQDKNGTRCGLVDADYGQTLVVELGSAGGPGILSADLDIEFKFGSSLKAEAFDGQGTVVPLAPLTGLPDDGADNGPDSGDGDNYRVGIRPQTEGDLFSRLVLTPVNGSFALEGGGDGTSASTLDPGTSASVFEIPGGEGLLLCGEESAESEDGVTVFLTDCATGDSVPYLLEREETEAGLLVDEILFAVPGSATNAYRVIIEWSPEEPVYPVTEKTQIVYFEGEEPRDLPWCTGVEESPTLPPGLDVLPDADYPDYPGPQGYCLVSSKAVIGPNGEITVTEELYGVGDPRFNRI